MLKKVEKAITQYNMLKQNCVTVALSGGADSVCLLYVLLELKQKYNLNVKAAHLNHMLRGEESERDEIFVKNLCQNLGVELVCERVDIKAECEITKESTELAARRIRYEFLKRAANNGLVATAHTASDSAETVIFNLTRGTAAKGLCGIPPVRDIFIRPLIFCTRTNIEEYCKKNNIAYVNDSTNFEDIYTRNKIRHKVIPVLKEINASFEGNILKTIDILQSENNYLESVSQELFLKCLNNNSLNIKPLVNSHKAIIRRVIKKYLDFLKLKNISVVNIDDIYKIILSGSGRIVLQGKTIINVENGICCALKNQKIPEYSVTFKKITRQEYENIKKVNSLLLKNCLDYDKIVGEPVIRTRIEGDKIRLAKKGVTKTFKKLYNEYKISNSQRPFLPVMADNLGPIWVHGIGIDERVSPSGSTKNYLIINSKLI